MGCNSTRDQSSYDPLKKQETNTEFLFIKDELKECQVMDSEQQSMNNNLPEVGGAEDTYNSKYNPNLLLQEFKGKPQRSQIYNAIKDNDLDKTIAILKQSFQPNEEVSADNYKWTALHYVCRFNRSEILEYMLKTIWEKNQNNYIDILNIQNHQGYTPLIMASAWKAIDCTKILKNFGGSDPSLISQNGNALEVARYYKCYQAISLLADVKLDQIIPVNNQELSSFDEAQIKQKHQENMKNQQAQLVFSIEQYKGQNSNNSYLEGMDKNSETYKILKKCIDENKCFEDPVFPRTIDRICCNKSHKSYASFQSAVWLRPFDIFKCNYDNIKLFENKIEPSDIKQGNLGVCYMLATLCSLSQHEQRVKNLFINVVSNPYGVYGVVLYPNGKRTEIVIDDYFPCEKEGEDTLFSKPNGCELWVMLLEKAWCKLFKSYADAEAETPRNFMEDVLGCPTKYFAFDKLKGEQAIWELIKSTSSQKYPLVLTSKTEKIEGIVANHAYCLFDSYDINGIKLVKIMNPWRKFEWQGDYSDKSNKWTADLKKVVGWKDEEDGIFFMTPKEVSSCFISLCIAYFQEKYVQSSVQVLCQHNQDNYFTFELKEKLEVNLKLNQPYKRTIQEENYEYSSQHIELWKENSASNIQLIAEGGEGYAYGNKSTCFSDNIFQTLEQGKYIIRVRISWFDKKARQISISSYTAKPIEFKTLNETLGKKLRNIAIDCQAMQLAPTGNQDIKYYSQWLRYGMVFKAVNLNKKFTYAFQMKFPIFENILIDSKYQKEDKDVSVTLAQNKSAIMFFEKINLKEKSNIDWKFESQWL